MKKLISLLCVLAMVIGVMAVSAVSTGAVDSAKTMVDVKKGQDVTYVLKLSDVDLPVIGTDYSIYYDSSVLSVDSVADFTNSTNEEEWGGLINTALNGEVRGNWSILNGVKFNEQRNFITVNFKAIADGSTDISYYIRYLYDKKVFNPDKTQPQISKFKFTCDVNVDGDPVLEDAQPELNVDQPQEIGIFINSVTGDSNDVDADLPGVVVNKEKGVAARDSYLNSDYDPDAEEEYVDENSAANNAVQNGDSAQNGGSGQNIGSAQNGGNGSAAAATSAPPATTADGYYVAATDAQGNVTATSDEVPAANTTGTNNKKGGASPVLWIVIALVVLAGGGAIVYFAMKKKSEGNAPAAGAVQAPDAVEAPETPETPETSETPENTDNNQ